MDALFHLYTSFTGATPSDVEILPGAGSNRRYVRYRATDGSTLIGVIGTDICENRCFIYLTEHFASRGLPVARVLAVSDDGSRYLLSDLGRIALYDVLRQGRESGGHYSIEEQKHLERAIRLLPHLQVEGGCDIDSERLLSPRVFDAMAAMFDLNYFKYCFLRTHDLPYDEVRLEEDFRQLAHDLSETDASSPSTFLFRDFQARNILLVGDKQRPYVIDYQGGRMGPLQYDVASFLWQASARYPDTLRETLISAYLDELRGLCCVDETAWRKQLQRYVLFRVLQVLGAYGLRGYFERKTYFLKSIPPALENLRGLLDTGVCHPYPYLESILRSLLTASPTVTLTSAVPSVSSGDVLEPVASAEAPALVVRVYSFSYKRGIPQDESGNGGGYVFDCRSTHNPGRYAAYKQLTGLDAPVIRFLEEDGEITEFLTSVYALAEKHVARYIERGFTSLMFCFGCTGGQHRSVYCAQHLAEHLHRRFGVTVQLCHREQQISKTYSATR